MVIPILPASSMAAPSAGEARRSRISTAARTARSASSSCTCGIPNTATTASPMNFSTVPPWRSIAVRISSKYRRRSGFSTSGSCCSAKEVEPTRSQNSAVTVLRTSRVGAAGSSRAAHDMQNAASSGFSLPQLGHVSTAGAIRPPTSPRTIR